MAISMIGEKVKLLRMDMGLTLDKLAKFASVSKSYIWDIENGKVPRPSAENVFAIANALMVDTEFLINDDYKLNGDDEAKIFTKKYLSLSEDKRKSINDLINLWSTK